MDRNHGNSNHRNSDNQNPLDQTIPLWQVCTDFYFPRRLTIQHEHTKLQYRFAINNLGEYLGRIPIVYDLTDDNVVGMMAHLRQKGLAPRTINERRSRLHALWTWLAKRGHVRLFPTTEPLPEPKRIPRAWSREQLQALFESIEQEDLPVGPIPGPLWWGAFIAVAWNTGERKSALLAIQWQHVELETREIYIPAEDRKGGSKAADMVYQLWTETVEVLKRLPRVGPLVFPWQKNRTTIYNRYRRILQRAKLPCDRRSLFHRIRVSHASWVKALGGNATDSLGHSSPETTRRHYEDPRICRAEAPPLFKPWRQGKSNQDKREEDDGRRLGDGLG